MKILAVSYYLPPYLYAQSIVIGRWFYHLAKDRRFLLSVVTAEEHSKASRLEIYDDIFSLFQDSIRVPFSYNRYLDKIKFTLLPFLFATPDIFKAWNRPVKKRILDRWGKNDFDLVLTVSSPQSTHLLGLFLKDHFHARWLAYFSDPWVENPYYKYRSLIKDINNSMEREVFQKADTLVFASEATREAYAAKYPSIGSKSFVLEHSYDSSLYPVSGGGTSGRKTLVARYLGNLSLERSPEPFLKAIRLLFLEDPRLREKFRFEIVGGHRSVPGLIRRHSLSEAVNMRPLVSYAKSLELMQDSDVLVVIDAPAQKNIFLPSKLIDYLGAKRPILGITPKGVSADIISEGGGWVADPSDIGAIARAIRDVIACWEKGGLGSRTPLEGLRNKYEISKKIDELKAILLAGKNNVAHPPRS